MPNKIVNREEWLKARVKLLAEEKELTRRSDALAKERKELPWVKIDKQYKFETENGAASLPDLFQGRTQLIVYHFMFGPDYKAGCPSCSSIADSFNGVYTHLANHDVMFMAVSRAPLAQFLPYKKRLGWTFPWASSHGNDFNFDFNISFTDEQQRQGKDDYNYASGGHLTDESKVPEGVVQFAATCGTDALKFTADRPGMSSFALEDGKVYHTYSAYARGLDVLWSMYQWLDRAPKGRNETGLWLRRHDEYDAPPLTQISKSCCHGEKARV